MDYAIDVTINQPIPESYADFLTVIFKSFEPVNLNR